MAETKTTVVESTTTFIRKNKNWLLWAVPTVIILAYYFYSYIPFTFPMINKRSLRKKLMDLQKQKIAAQPDSAFNSGYLLQWKNDQLAAHTADGWTEADAIKAIRDFQGKTVSFDQIKRMYREYSWALVPDLSDLGYNESQIAVITKNWDKV